MQLDPETLKQLDPLTLSNTVTVSALVALLVRKGLISHEELTTEVRVLRARIGAPPAPG